MPDYNYNTPQLTPHKVPASLPGHPRFNGVNTGNLWAPLAEQTQAREGQASQADVLLAINRMMGLAPATAARYGGMEGTPVTPVIPSQQAAREADFIYGQSGARTQMPREQQMALVQALMQKLGIF